VSAGADARRDPPDGLHALLIDTQRRLEALYAIEPQPAVVDFLIPHDEAHQYPGGGSRTLVSQQGEDLSVGVLLEPAVADELRQADPRVQLDHSNLQAFCAVTEEVSHFLYVLFCARFARSVTQLELELQGEVDKYLCAAFVLSLQNEGAVAASLHERLFRHYRLAPHVDAEQEERYRAASRLAGRYCRWLERRFLRGSHLHDLARESRRFYRLGQREKLERIAELQ
jgi:hypothetical protein